MNRANSLRLIGALVWGAALAASSAAQVRRTSAVDYLRVAFDTTQKATYVAVQNHRIPVRDPQTIQVKIEQADETRLRQTVLQPLSSQGIVTVDDGREWKQLFPDTKRINVGPSPRANRVNTAASMALAAKNYSFEFGGAGEVAGRRTIQVVAKPNQRLLPTRTYWIDAETDVLLRIDLLFPNKQSIRFLDTLSITYAKAIADSRFVLDPPPGYAVRQIPLPIPVKTAGDAQSLVRFAPPMKLRATMGFETTAIEAVGDEGARMIAYRLSDGLVRLTIYTNLTSRVGNSSPFQSVNMTKGTLTYAIVGELMDDALADLLQRFLAAASATVMPLAELDAGIHLLHKDTIPLKGSTDDGQFSSVHPLGAEWLEMNLEKGIGDRKARTACCP
ncbi:MAG: sigma-E factor regulatory protein RseB domain-containing protein [Fimbriimonadaceae bacterium]